MFDRMYAYLRECARRTSPRFATVLLACTLLALAWNSPVGHVQAAHSLARIAAPLPVDAARLNGLRNEAASGNELSNLELSRVLLDRYDQSGNTDDLYEALVWIDRHWDRGGGAELTGRVVANYCGQRVVRWHWLCDPGE